MTCSFFGHRYIDEAIAAPLKNALTNLIANNVDTFLVGHQGDFDRLVLRTLRQPKKEFPQIRYRVVLAYLPAAPAACCAYTEEETVFPEGLETVPPPLCHFMAQSVDDQAIGRCRYLYYPFPGQRRTICEIGKENEQTGD